MRRVYFTALLLFTAGCHAVASHEAPPYGSPDGSPLDSHPGEAAAEDSLFDLPPRPERALELSGSQWVVVEQLEQLSPPELTVEAWVETSASAGLCEGAPRDQQHILSHHNHAGRGYALLMSGKHAELRTYHGAGLSCTCYSPELEHAGRWLHLAGTFSQGVCRLFVNGRLSAHRICPTASYEPHLGDLRVGDDSDGINPCFQFVGRIDEVRISSRDRHGASGFLVPAARYGCDPYTVALWHFDSESGQTAPEACGRALFDGQLGNSSAEDNNDPQWVSAPAIADRPSPSP